MNISKYLNTINDINLIIEVFSKSDVEKNIKDTGKKIDNLSKRVRNYKNTQNLPYSEIIINFYNEINLSVRTADEKKEDVFVGRNYFDVVGFSDDYLILQKKEWDSSIALQLSYNKLDTRITQLGVIKLFYNRNGDVSDGVANRSSKKEDIRYEIIKLK